MPCVEEGNMQNHFKPMEVWISLHSSVRESESWTVVPPLFSLGSRSSLSYKNRSHAPPLCALKLLPKPTDLCAQEGSYESGCGHPVVHNRGLVDKCRIKIPKRTPQCHTKVPKSTEILICYFSDWSRWFIYFSPLTTGYIITTVSSCNHQRGTSRCWLPWSWQEKLLAGSSARSDWPPTHLRCLGMREVFGGSLANIRNMMKQLYEM